MAGCSDRIDINPKNKTIDLADKLRSNITPFEIGQKTIALIKENNVFGLVDTISQGFRFKITQEKGKNIVFVYPQSLGIIPHDKNKSEDYTLIMSNNDNIEVYLHNEVLR